MAERIYIEGPAGGLDALNEKAFATEDELQKLIAEHPELLDGERITPGDPRRWIVITREKGIAETSDAGARWALDLLIVDQEAVPTLVEVKRGSSPELRRTVVGQMLEYAAHASQSWTGDELRQCFEKTSHTLDLDHHDELAKLLQADGEPDVEGFWQRLVTNLRAKKLRLIFVADDIPDPLARVVELLNEQLRDIEVLAIEVKQFRSQSARTLVPRVLGRTAARVASGRRANLTREEFLQRFSDLAERDAVSRLFGAAVTAGAVLAWGPSGVSIRGHCPAWTQSVSVAWLFPPDVSGWMGLQDITFGEGISDYHPELDERLRAILRRWVKAFSSDDFSVIVSKKGIRGVTIRYGDAARHIGPLEKRLTSVLAELASL
ncbi:MAG: hypothetical protein OXG79_04575 [Chloroflexi bacterium]|nr:hypothetical protein [Chloroflexota bacterium]